MWQRNSVNPERMIGRGIMTFRKAFLLISYPFLAVLLAASSVWAYEVTGRI